MKSPNALSRWTLTVLTAVALAGLPLALSACDKTEESKSKTTTTTTKETPTGTTKTTETTEKKTEVEKKPQTNP